MRHKERLKMKNLTKLFVFAAFIAIIGFTVAACGSEEDQGGDNFDQQFKV